QIFSFPNSTEHCTASHTGIMSDRTYPYKSPYIRFVGVNENAAPKKATSRAKIPAPDVGLRSPTPGRHSAHFAEKRKQQSGAGGLAQCQHQIKACPLGARLAARSRPARNRIVSL